MLSAMTPTKRPRGRPPTGGTPGAERTARSKQALLDAGGRRITLNLSPDAVQILEAIKAFRPDTIKTDREAIEFALACMVEDRL